MSLSFVVSILTMASFMTIFLTLIISNPTSSQNCITPQSQSYCLSGLVWPESYYVYETEYKLEGIKDNCPYFKSNSNLYLYYDVNFDEWNIGPNLALYSMFCDKANLDQCTRDSWYEIVGRSFALRPKATIQSCTYNNTQCEHQYEHIDSFCIYSSIVEGTYSFDGCSKSKPYFVNGNYTLEWNDVFPSWIIISTENSDIQTLAYCQQTDLEDCDTNWYISVARGDLRIDYTVLSSFCASNTDSTIITPTTTLPTTASPTAALPTTAFPTTASPTTPLPTSQSPTTTLPTTTIPTTRYPMTSEPTTSSPTTTLPTTTSPTTASPATDISTTSSPTASSPITTSSITASPTIISTITQLPTNSSSIQSVTTTSTSSNTNESNLISTSTTESDTTYTTTTKSALNAATTDSKSTTAKSEAVLPQNIDTITNSTTGQQFNSNPDDGDNMSMIGIVLCIVSGTLLITILFICICFVCRRRKTKKKYRHSITSLSHINNTPRDTNNITSEIKRKIQMGQIEVVESKEIEGKRDQNMNVNKLALHMEGATAGESNLNNEPEDDVDIIYDQQEIQDDFEIVGDDEITTTKGNYT